MLLSLLMSKQRQTRALMPAQQNVEPIDLNGLLLIGCGGRSVAVEKLVRQLTVFPGLLRLTPVDEV